MEATSSNRNLKIGIAAGVGIATIAVAGICAQPAMASSEANVWLNDHETETTIYVGQIKTLAVNSNIDPMNGTYKFSEKTNKLFHWAINDNFVNDRGITKSEVLIQGARTGKGTASATYTTAGGRVFGPLTMSYNVKTSTFKKKGATYQSKYVRQSTLKKAKKTSKKFTVPATVKVRDTKGSKVVAIASKAFKGNKKVTKVTVGKNVKKIGSKAFQNTRKLKTLTIKSTKLKKNSVKNSLKGSSITKVKAPKGKVKAYKKIFTKANAGKKVTVTK